jgi:hypothetical protein
VSDPIKAALAGVHIITSAALVETRPYPRSPSRAKRRAAMGHRQHTRVVPARIGYMIGPNTMVVHPMMAAAIRAKALEVKS